ncbi:MAG: hypothetical protein KDJ75_04690 [Alphaproteobacteria bacterium]|nr:hypothetical protein [Alphaproteobacteria bacterium]
MDVRRTAPQDIMKLYLFFRRQAALDFPIETAEVRTTLEQDSLVLHAKEKNRADVIGVLTARPSETDPTRWTIENLILSDENNQSEEERQRTKKALISAFVEHAGFGSWTLQGDFPAPDTKTPLPKPQDFGL